MKIFGKTLFLIAWILAAGMIVQAVGIFYTGQEFSQRREKLMAETRDAVIIVDGALSPSEFTYLTGVSSRGGKLILIPPQAARRSPNPEYWQTTIYLPPDPPRVGVWDDYVLSPGDDTKTPTGIENNAPESAFMADVAKIGQIAETVYIPFRQTASDPGQLPPDLKFVQQVQMVHPDIRIKNLLPILDRMRWQKTAAQIEVMRQACDITTEAYKEAARYMRPGLYEYEIDGLVDYIFRRNAVDEAAFLIIGSGPNSCILHHMTNDRQIGDSELVVLDIGAVMGNISTDLTRTIPSSGTYTDEQKDVYQVVLKANKAAIDMVRPGITLNQIHWAAKKIIADAGYGKYFMHGTCHGLNGGNASNPLNAGISLPKEIGRYDTSDVPLKPGSMFTIEPGIYIPEKSLGIRIEDDILVTSNGREVLTAAAPKEIADIEKLMKEEPVFIKK